MDMDVEHKEETSQLDSDSHSTSEFGQLEGWNQEEKYNLLIGIKDYGSSNIQEISALIPSKSTEDVKLAINYYKVKLNKNYNSTTTDTGNKKRNAYKKTQMPLSNWAKFLTDSFDFKDLQTETVSALRLIAEFEDIPAAVLTDNIDFKKMYLSLADAMEGKAFPNDQSFNLVIEKCLLDVALTSKTFMRGTILRKLLKTLTLMPKETGVYSNKPTKEHEFAIIRHLASQRSYNPLNIPQEYLKASK